ncbi:MAG TPA: hypothetical protein VJ398_07195 [Acidimicrobiia bacterium]|nr:hypothetical protein [Acidimicrobiia bacterium]
MRYLASTRVRPFDTQAQAPSRRVSVAFDEERPVPVLGHPDPIADITAELLHRGDLLLVMELTDVLPISVRGISTEAVGEFGSAGQR